MSSATLEPPPTKPTPPSNQPEGSSISHAFPKSSRILKPSDFRKVYDQGTRMTSPSFAAFILPSPTLEQENHFGFTTPKALGKAVVRNRIRRRMREAVRLEQHRFAPGFEIVFNPRRTVLTADFDALRQEVAKVASRCKR